MFKIEFTVIFMAYLTFITMSANLEISRVRQNTTNGWKKETDSFKIPSSLCDHGTTGNFVNCTTFNAKMSGQNGSDQCSCSCPKGKATLMFKNDDWRCRKNTEVRNMLGSEGKAYFYGECQEKELRMLSINDDRRLDIPWTLYNCDVDVSSSRYIRCNGSEGRLWSSPFKLQKRNGYQRYPYYVKVQKGTLNTDLLKGRVIKLKIRCTRPWQTKNYVLLFKYEGHLNCSISTLTLQPSVTTKPLDTTVTLPPSKTEHVTTDTKPTQMTSDSVSSPTLSITISTLYENPRTASDRPPTVSDIPKTVSITPTMVSEISPTVFEVPPTYSEAPLTVSDAPLTGLVPQPTKSDATTDYSSKVPLRPSSSRERSTSKTSTSVALIAGLTASIIILVIIVTVVFLVYRRYFSNKKPYSSNKSVERKETVAMDPQTRSTNGQENESDYKELEFGQSAVYTSSYQVPCRDREAHSINTRDSNGNSKEGHVYAPLNCSVGENVYGHRNDQETVANDMKPQTNGPISVDQCVYGLMEEIILTTLKGPARGTHNGTQPVYNVLEGSYLHLSQISGQSGTTSSDGPVYNRLDGPVNYIDKDTKPVYDVLEAPHLKGAEECSHYGAMGPKEPLYYILEGPVSDNESEPVYNVLEAPDLEGAEGPNHYSAMSQEGPNYQTLEQSNQNNTNEANDLKITNEPIYNVLEEVTY